VLRILSRRRSNIAEKKFQMVLDRMEGRRLSEVCRKKEINRKKGICISDMKGPRCCKKRRQCSGLKSKSVEGTSFVWGSIKEKNQRIIQYFNTRGEKSSYFAYPPCAEGPQKKGPAR